MKVKYVHMRSPLHPRNGGATVRIVQLPDSKDVQVQVAWCCKRDPFCRKTGRMVAEKAHIDTIPLKRLGAELQNIEFQMICQQRLPYFRKHPERANVYINSWDFIYRDLV